MIQQKLSLVLIILITSGCIDPPQYDDEYEAQFERETQNPRELFASGYFPEVYGEPIVGNCDWPSGPHPLIGEVEEDWFSDQLIAAREPSLHLLSQQQLRPSFILRFSYLPSFSPSIFVRVYKDTDDHFLIAKRLSGLGGYDAGTIASSKKIRLTSDQVDSLKRLLVEEALFNEPADDCSIGFDGATLIFEQVDENGYKMVKRWSPSEGSAYNLGLHLHRLTGWNTDQQCIRPLPYPFQDTEFACR
ncbi:hypothetical protein [Altererythrobacter sp.]|uniref:hypothetical protein n=1 Tax=Altererythrobacter sp. TaxID=1872480 RepID=UPI003D127182